MLGGRSESYQGKKEKRIKRKKKKGKMHYKIPASPNQTLHCWKEGEVCLDVTKDSAADAQ